MSLLCYFRTILPLSTRAFYRVWEYLHYDRDTDLRSHKYEQNDFLSCICTSNKSHMNKTYRSVSTHVT